MKLLGAICFNIFKGFLLIVGISTFFVGYYDRNVITILAGLLMCSWPLYTMVILGKSMLHEYSERRKAKCQRQEKAK